MIVDVNGRPLTAAGGRGRARADSTPGTIPVLAGNPGAAFAYDAADIATQEMGSWHPVIRSPDAEINWFRDRMVARSRDLTRNSGWAAGGITRILDNVVGTSLRLSAMPDYRALAQRTGITAFDVKWADEFRRAAEALWRGYAVSYGRWNDVNRKLTTGQQFRLALRHKLVDGEALSMAYWLPERVGYGAADYATAFLLVDPDRLSNPFQGPDTKYMRGGVEIDDHGVSLAVHVREAQQNDWYNAIESNTWRRVICEDDDGWRRVYLDYDMERAGQHRGTGIFTPVLSHMKMLARYYGVELQQATLAATLGTYVQSPYDPALVAEAIGDESDGELQRYQQLRADWAKERPATFGGVRVPTLAPGEEIVSVSSAHPHGNFAAFAHEMLCVFAAASGVSVEQVTQDWSRTNYSSARAALMETWKTLMRRRDDFTTNTATPWYATWLREAMELGQLPLPAGAPEFVAMPTEYSRCKWLGPARGYIDGVKEPQGAQVRMEIGVSTLQDEAAEQGGDWEEKLDQRELEIKEFRRRDIPIPAWGGEVLGQAETGEGSHDPTSPNYRSK